MCAEWDYSICFFAIKVRLVIFLIIIKNPHSSSNYFLPNIRGIAKHYNYISLEKLRYGENLKISFTKEIVNETAMIAPLILLSIVENAFKHGASGTTEVPVITINLIETEGKLNFTVFNSKENEDNQDQLRKGIGGQNIKKQLALLYPNEFDYQVVEDSISYEVILKINLNNSSNEN